MSTALIRKRTRQTVNAHTPALKRPTKISPNATPDLLSAGSIQTPPVTQAQTLVTQNCLIAPAVISEAKRYLDTYELHESYKCKDGLFLAFDRSQNVQRIVRRMTGDEAQRQMHLAYVLKPNADDSEDTRRTYEKNFPPDARMILARTENVEGEDKKYDHFLVEPKTYGGLHAYVVEKKTLPEDECREYFRQIVQLVVDCHRRKVVVRDLKLRKFVFADPERKYVRLEDANEMVVCEKDVAEGENFDMLSDRHGCPAYVSPEILDLTQTTYSGCAADVWSLGVLLYVLLYGRYPFYDQTPAGLFSKIRQARLPNLEQFGSVPIEARALIRALLKRDPKERPKAADLLSYPWLQRKHRKFTCVPEEEAPKIGSSSSVDAQDQCVPCVEEKRSGADAQETFDFVPNL